MKKNLILITIFLVNSLLAWSETKSVNIYEIQYKQDFIDLDRSIKEADSILKNINDTDGASKDALLFKIGDEVFQDLYRKQMALANRYNRISQKAEKELCLAKHIQPHLLSPKQIEICEKSFEMMAEIEEYLKKQDNEANKELLLIGQCSEAGNIISDQLTLDLLQQNMTDIDDDVRQKISANICEKRGNKDRDAKDIMKGVMNALRCQIVSDLPFVKFSAWVSGKLFDKPNKMKEGCDEKFSCGDMLFSSMKRSFFDSLEGLYALVKSAYDGTLNYFDGKVERAVAAQAKTLSRSSNYEVENFTDAPLDYVLERLGDLAKTLGNDINSWVLNDIACFEWSGEPHNSKCLVPGNWNCFSDAEYLNVACSAAGTLIGSAGGGLVGGGAVAGVAKVASLAGKVAKAAKAKYAAKIEKAKNSPDVKGGVFSQIAETSSTYMNYLKKFAKKGSAYSKLILSKTGAKKSLIAFKEKVIEPGARLAQNTVEIINGPGDFLSSVSSEKFSALVARSAARRRIKRNASRGNSDSAEDLKRFDDEFKSNLRTGRFIQGGKVRQRGDNASNLISGRNDSSRLQSDFNQKRGNQPQSASNTVTSSEAPKISDGSKTATGPEKTNLNAAQSGSNNQPQISSSSSGSSGKKDNVSLSGDKKTESGSSSSKKDNEEDGNKLASLARTTRAAATAVAAYEGLTSGPDKATEHLKKNQTPQQKQQALTTDYHSGGVERSAQNAARTLGVNDPRSITPATIQRMESQINAMEDPATSERLFQKFAEEQGYEKNEMGKARKAFNDRKSSIKAALADLKNLKSQAAGLSSELESEKSKPAPSTTTPIAAAPAVVNQVAPNIIQRAPAATAKTNTVAALLPQQGNTSASAPVASQSSNDSDYSSAFTPQAVNNIVTPQNINAANVENLTVDQVKALANSGDEVESFGEEEIEKISDVESKKQKLSEALALMIPGYGDDTAKFDGYYQATVEELNLGGLLDSVESIDEAQLSERLAKDIEDVKNIKSKNPSKIDDYSINVNDLIVIAEDSKFIVKELIFPSGNQFHIKLNVSSADEELPKTMKFITKEEFQSYRAN